MGETHAVVLGAGMAGLLSARVLADEFDRVTVVDRDDLDGPVGVRPRRGVPQGRHAHALLAGGLQVLEELLPTATADLVAGGAAVGDVLGEVRYCPNGQPLKQAPSGLEAIAISRPYLESYVRSRIAGRPGVTLMGGHDVVGVEVNDARTQVVGARVQQRAQGSAAESIAADLVVDATGYGSRAPRWLVEWGYQPPVEERVAVDIGYSSRHYRIGRDRLGGDLAIIIGPTRAHPRGGVIQVQEQGRAIVTLFGILGDHPPVDPAGFEAFAATLPLPFVADAIRGAEALDDAVLYRHPGSTRLRYDKLRRFPAGFLVVGDALCSFNPMYGQGMTVAARQAARVRAAFDDAPAFFRAVQPLLDAPWQVATGGDLSNPAVRGPRPLTVRLVNRYLARLHAKAVHDPVLSEAFIRVTNLVAPPQSLMRPALAVRVLRKH